MTGQRLVDRVVYGLINQLVEPRAVVRIANVHTGALPHRFAALEHLNVVCIVGRLFHLVHSPLDPLARGRASKGQG